MQPSVFTKIIKGQIPCYKIYEDDKSIAFLDIHPARPGHILVVPKTQADRLEELNDDDYLALMHAVKLVMRHLVEVFGRQYRACLKLEGFDVAHAHIHIIPCQSAADFWAKPDETQTIDTATLAAMQERLAFKADTHFATRNAPGVREPSCRWGSPPPDSLLSKEWFFEK